MQDNICVKIGVDYLWIESRRPVPLQSPTF